MVGARARWGLLPLLLLAAIALSGCAHDAVSNRTDVFSYGGQVAGKSGTQSHAWKVTGPTVTISWGGQSSSGSFDLRLKDSAGQQVYTRSFGSTAQGGATDILRNVRTGDWTITLDFHAFTGQMGLSLQSSAGDTPTVTNSCPPGIAYC